MTGVGRALVVIAGIGALMVLASPAGATPPAAPAATCLLDGSCLLGPAADPCVPVNGADPCHPCADPACLTPVPDLPVDVPSLPVATPAFPVPGVIPALPAEPAPAADAPTPAPGTDGSESTSSAGGAEPDPAQSPGGGGSGPRRTSVDTSSTSSRSAAVAHAARSFALLFVLVGLVGGYLLVQGRLDARDPKLIAAPIDRDDEVVSFQ